MDYRQKIPLLFDTNEFRDKDSANSLWWFSLSQKEKLTFARRILKKYVSKECPFKCLFCIHIENIEFEELPNKCDRYGKNISSDGFCECFTPEDDMYERNTFTKDNNS